MLNQVRHDKIIKDVILNLFRNLKPFNDSVKKLALIPHGKIFALCYSKYIRRIITCVLAYRQR